MTNPDDYTMAVGAVAKALGVTDETVRNYADRGELSFVVKRKGKVSWKYFNPSEVETLVKKLSEGNSA